MTIPVGTKIKVSGNNQQTKDFVGEYEVVTLGDDRFEEEFALRVFGPDVVRVIATDGTPLLFVKGEYEVVND